MSDPVSDQPRGILFEPGSSASEDCSHAELHSPRAAAERIRPNVGEPNVSGYRSSRY